jgi:hypothetical protein
MTSGESSDRPPNKEIGMNEDQEESRIEATSEDTRRRPVQGAAPPQGDDRQMSGASDGEVLQLFE